MSLSSGPSQRIALCVILEPNNKSILDLLSDHVLSDHVLIQEHNISFRVEDINSQLASQNDKSKVSQTLGALAIPNFKKWNSAFSQVIWTVSWTVTGLSPVRPLIVTTKDITLAKSCCVAFPAEE